MTSALRDALSRLGDEAPPLAVPDDVWRQGRRARTRGRLLTVATALALVAVLGGVFWSLPRDRAVAPAAPTGSAAVPSYLWEVPDWLVQSKQDPYGRLSWAPELTPTVDLAVGPVAAAFQVAVDPGSGGLPVVVTADDGAYLPLVLPGYSDAAPLNWSGSSLSLAPDGEHLAYAWWDPAAPLDRPMPAGVRVVDLVSGDVTTVALEGGNGLDVQRIVWSPDSQWLAWVGDATRSWTPMSRSSGGDMLVGRVGVGSTESTSTDLGRRGSGDPTVAVADSGELAVWDLNRLRRWDGDWLPAMKVKQPDSRGVVTSSLSNGATGRYLPDGRLVLAGATGGPMLVVDPESGEVVEREAGDGVYRGVAATRPLGASADGMLAALALPPASGGEGSEADQVELVLATPTLGARSTWRIVGRMDKAVASTLTVATDLMTLESPTAERSEPDWPWSIERRTVVWSLSGLALLLGVGLILLLVRTRRPR